MAKTEVQITAVDKTQAAVRSAANSLKTIEKTAKVTGKAINLAFGLLTGGALVSAFGKLTDAAKKTDEGRKALDDLARTLKDPGLVSAANALSSALISGFTKALQAAASMIKFVRSELIRMGIYEGAGGARDAADVIRGQIRDLERAIAAPGIGMTGEAGQKLSQALIADLNARKQQLALVERLAEAEAEAERARIDREVAAEAAAKDKPKTARAAARAPKKQEAVDWAAKMLERANERFDDWAKSLDDKLVDQLADSGKIMGEGLADSIVAGIDKRLLPQTGPLAEFAAEAAMQMQGVFAEFLFDPFEQGLKGMARGFVDILRRMLADLMARQLLLSFFGIFTKGTGIVSSIANAAVQGLQARALGGPVSGNQPYLVGERGPELFVPAMSGEIIANNRKDEMLKALMASVGQIVPTISNKRDEMLQVMMGSIGQILSADTFRSLQGRAMGGPVTGNTPYMVGERGPELFVPSTGGTVMRNGADMGVTVSPVYNIDARGATMELAQALPTILADNNRRIFDELDRRYGIRR